MKLPARFLALALVGCLDLQPPPVGSSPQWTNLRANGRTLDAVPRVPELVVSFDRAMASPEPSSVMLFREPISSALVADARDGVVSIGRLDNRVPLRVQTDPADPRRWSLRVAEVLPPSTPLTLVFSDRARSIDGRSVTDDDDGGVRATGVALQVVDAPHAGPVLTPAVTETVDADAAVLWLHADRPVRLLEPGGVSLTGDDRTAIATRAEPEDRTVDGLTRVLRVTPTRAMRPGVTYGWRVGGVSSRASIAAEDIPWRMLAVAPAPVTVRLIDGVVCAAGERSLGGACVELGDRFVTVRAATTAAAVTRLAVTGVDGRRTTIAAQGTTHRLRVSGLTPASDVRWRLEAWDPAGRLRDVREGALHTADAAPRVRIVEVLARPHSSSAQEFIEVLNEEDAAVALEGWVLESGGARSALPAGATVAGRGRAVIVGASFDPRGVTRANDPAVEAGARVIVLRGSIAGRGLRDTGADLMLATGQGLIVSRYPGTAPELLPVEGVSAVRADPELEDDDPAAWARARDGGSSPGGPNDPRNQGQ